MDKGQLLKIIRENNLSMGGGPAAYQFTNPFMHGFMRTKRYYKEHYSWSFIIFDNGVCTQTNDEKQNFRNIEQLYDNTKQTLKYIKMSKKQTKYFWDYCKRKVKSLEEMNDKELFRQYTSFLDLFADVWTLSLPVDIMGIYTETVLLDSFLDAVNGRNIERKKLIGYYVDLCKPSYNSFIVKEHISLLKLTLLYKKNHSSQSFMKRLNQHQQEYFWVLNNYKEAKVLDTDYFLRKIEHEAARERKDILKELKGFEDNIMHVREQRRIFKMLGLKGKVKDHLLLTQNLAQWQDERRAMNMFGNNSLNEFLKEFSRRGDLPLSLVKNMNPSEIKEWFLDKKPADRKKIARREKAFVYVMELPEKETLFDFSDAEEIIAAVKAKEKGNEIKGLVASYGDKDTAVIVGKVKVITDVSKKTLEDGEILVASMTRPEYVPIMKKALAIITDEGGITSHAAVISRELNIPCIIGTKTATTLLKDGDMVEIDKEHGVVRKI